jgi:glucose-6-phosphate 1-dehydrogenase
VSEEIVLDSDQAEDRAQSYDPAPPCALVLFGAGGDLTRRLIAPALYNLAQSRLLADGFRIIGVDLADLSTQQWQDSLRNMIEEFIHKGAQQGHDVELDQTAWSFMTARMHYMRGDFADPATFTRIADALTGDQRATGGNALFYLAVAARFFGPLAQSLAAAGLLREAPEGPFRRLIVEKPFGHDYASAVALNTRLLSVADESQIYRMDHFLGKETVQNIMMFRFGNSAFESLWNRDHIDHVQITAAETVGVERRGGFYDQTGALRDMVPNHLFQLLAVTAMEPPVSFDADAVRIEKRKVLQAVHELRGDAVWRDAVRGQYAAGTVDGVAKRAYREEPDVAADSNTETYVALKLSVDNWRWGGVPFYLRTGKHLAARRTEIMLHFRSPPFSLFRGTEVENLLSNRLILHIQPDEGVSIQFNAKVPGAAVHARNVRMDFNYADFFNSMPSTGYETLLYDCMIGDATLFATAAFVESGWNVVQPVIDAWRSQRADFPNYEAGSQGPREADALLAREGRRAQDGRRWRKIGARNAT